MVRKARAERTCSKLDDLSSPIPGRLLTSSFGALFVAFVLCLCRPPQALAQNSMDPQEQAALDGAITGAVVGTYTAAWAVFAQGAGGGRSSALPWMAAGPILGGLVGAGTFYLIAERWPGLWTTQPSAQNASRPSLLNPSWSNYDLVRPVAGQFDIQLENMFGFVGPGGESLVRVREFAVNGSGLHFSYLGIDTALMPTVDVRYWFDSVNAIHFRFRYTDIGGTSVLVRPAFYNGALMAPGPIHTDPSEWYFFGLYYERRLNPLIGYLFQKYEDILPSFLRGWDIRGRLGLEYNYIYFTFDHGHAPVVPNFPGGAETAEDFYHQSMPLPTIGMEAIRWIGKHFIVWSSVEGNWINRWNSLRNEGGTIWASQNGIEAHLRLYYVNYDWLGPFKPMAGFFVYRYSQLEDSPQDGNYLRWIAYGPEIGMMVNF